MVHESVDQLNGAEREAVLISRVDAERIGVANGDEVLLRSAVGEFRGKAALAPVTPGSLQIHWPEGLALIDRKVRSPQAGIPDYNAAVTVERVGARRTAD
jgi:anaerobic selenocysteine-containing dehydrogenase